MEDIQLAQIAPPSEVVIAVMLEISVLDMVGALSVCTPFSVLEDVLPRLTAQAWVGTGRKLGRANVVEDLRAQIERATVPVSAEVGSTTVRAQDVAALSVGDVIRLDSPASRTIPVRVGAVRKWMARPGLSDGRVAVRIERWDVEEMASRPAPRREPVQPAAESSEAAQAAASPAVAPEESEMSRAA